jgi:hypothetical protein
MLRSGEGTTSDANGPRTVKPILKWTIKWTQHLT